ncbi:MAG: transcription antitermination factor NusB [Pedosphaera sp.]|nr:transcription antitermination factor NusB [Pedosphaera sp.]
MRKRREARERAIQFLFQHDMNPLENVELALSQFWEGQRMNAYMESQGPTWGEQVQLPPADAEDAATQLFGDALIRGVLSHLEAVDAAIMKHAKNWDLRRMAVVDRNVMRLAVYEMLYRDDIPPVVSINEAVDVAKKFSTADSGKFVNGILDKVKTEILRPARTAKDSADASG